MYVCLCVCVCVLKLHWGMCLCVCLCAEVTLGCRCNGFNIDTNGAQRSHWLRHSSVGCVLRTAEAPGADLPWASESPEMQNNNPSFVQGGLLRRQRRGRKDENEQLPGTSGTCNDKESSQ